MLIDSLGIPRFWASVWSIYVSADLASSSKAQKLSYVESLYQFSEQLEGVGFLDDAIARVDLEKLGGLLDAFFVSIQNQPSVSENAEIKWRTAFKFVRETVLRLSKANLPLDGIHEIEVRLNRLNMLYQQLRVARRRTQVILRSLPASVVETLYQLLDPSSPANPFRNSAAKWRTFAIFILLLHQGLRRGELLSLPADGVKTAFDLKAGKERYWLSVAENPYEYDLRYSKPSIKTANSIRQVPVSELTSSIVDEYVGSFRGRPDHSLRKGMKGQGNNRNDRLQRQETSQGSYSLPPLLPSELPSVIRYYDDFTDEHRSIRNPLDLDMVIAATFLSSANAGAEDPRWQCSSRSLTGWLNGISCSLRLYLLSRAISGFR